MAQNHFVAFFKCGGNSPYYAWEYGRTRSMAMQHIERHEREEPGFRFVQLFEGSDAEQQAIRYARKNGLPLLPGINVDDYE